MVTTNCHARAVAWLRATLAGVLVCCCAAAPVLASGGGSGHGAPAEGHGSSPAAHDPKAPRTFDLGEFDIRNFRPTHNEIANIRFSLHLVVKPGTSDAVMAELEHWKRRLRAQAITAARMADPSDLAEPRLERVQRTMLLRIKRLPLPEPVVGVYLTDFAVTSG